MKSNDESETCRWIKDAVARYEGRLLRYAAQITGDAERARDVVQETFLRLCHQDRQQVDGHLAQWLYTVCRNRALDVRRKEKRMQSMTEQHESGRVSGEPEQSVAVEHREVAERVLQLVESLSENQREVVRL
ncbi:MAG: sigma-70 family RNA polymerase sigma factor [Planctomycetes bacterium]|nr:sigma-70 family RNA polymerase sigma factor [Planctomycetota bacterium]